MASPLNNMDWGNWLYGLFAGAIGGGASAVTVALSASAIDPHFAVGTPNSLKLMGLTFAISAAKDAFLYLKQNPLPKLRTDAQESSK
jgi:hypothetical protein